jgi:hypothetical protein
MAGQCAVSPGRGHADGSALALGRVREAGAGVVPHELGEVLQDLVLDYPAGKVAEHLAHADPGVAVARLSETHLRVEGEALEEAHRASVTRSDVQG